MNTKTKKVSAQNKILIAPLHYILDYEAQGSEFSWATNFYKKISSERDGFSFVVGGSNIETPFIKNWKIFNVQKLDLSLMNVIRFHLLTECFCIYKLLFGRLKVLHHFLPYSMDRSLLLSFLIPTRTTKIAGPVQNNLSFKDLDIDIRNARTFSTKNSFSDSRRNINPKFILRLIAKFSNYCLSKSDIIICTSEDVKENLINRGIKSDKLTIIPPVFTGRNSTQPINQHNPNSIRFVTASILIKIKHIDLIIKSFIAANIEAKHSLTIIGDGPEKLFLQNLALELGAQNINFIGHVDNSQIITTLSTYDVLICASKSESFSALSIESLMANNALISTDVGGFRDIVSS
jgi:glycosyltransferase involved in cell wall biosynthesis